MIQTHQANIQGLGSVASMRLERKLGDLPDNIMLKIKQVIVFSLDLEIDIQEDDIPEADNASA